MEQPDYVNKISELASGVGMAVDKVDYTVANKVVDMLYKLTPAGWDTLESLFPQISSTIAENAGKIEQMNYFFGINLQLRRLPVLTTSRSHGSSRSSQV